MRSRLFIWSLPGIVLAALKRFFAPVDARDISEEDEWHQAIK